MPERVFRYEETPDLIKIVKDLGEAVRSGSTQELRNSHTGFMVRTGVLNVTDLRTLYADARYEIFCRGRGSAPDAGDGDPLCAALEPNNPLRERVMHVEVQRGSVFFPPIRGI